MSNPPDNRTCTAPDHNTIRVLLGLSEPLVLTSVATLLHQDRRFTVGLPAREVHDPQAEHEPRVVLLDTRRPPEDADMLVDVPGVRGVVALTDSAPGKPSKCVPWRQAMAWQAISWTSPWPQIAEALRTVASQGSPMAVNPKPQPCMWTEQKKQIAALTTREHQVLRLIAEGLSVREASTVLKLAESTIDNHKSRLLKKFGVRKSVELVRIAYRMGLATP